METLTSESFIMRMLGRIAVPIEALLDDISQEEDYLENTAVVQPAA